MWQQDRLTCPECEKPSHECSDVDRSWYPYRRVCYATMEREAAVAAYSDLHAEAPFHNGSFDSWAKERSASHPYHFREGVKFGVADRDLTPDDLFTTEVNARPAL